MSDKIYRYETHLHTSPVSRCARATVRQTLEAYAKLGYDGVFITNHFLGGNVLTDPSWSYEECVRFYFSDYEQGVRIGRELGLAVFCGVEISYGGTDFLIYGVEKEWFLAHPEIMEIKFSSFLTLLAEAGALIIHAHPFREASYIDHIRLFPRHIHGVETFNACRTPFENGMADMYAKYYGLPAFSGSDNHRAGAQTVFGGMQSESPITSEKDFIERYRRGELSLFSWDTSAQN